MTDKKPLAYTKEAHSIPLLDLVSPALRAEAIAARVNGKPLFSAPVAARTRAARRSYGTSG
jgi:hypothetical protein